jgi:hypothetical protein
MVRAPGLMIDLSVRGSRNLLKESESTKGAAMSGIVDNPFVVFAAFLVAQWIAAISAILSLWVFLLSLSILADNAPAGE